MWWICYWSDSLLSLSYRVITPPPQKGPPTPPPVLSLAHLAWGLVAAQEPDSFCPSLAVQAPGVLPVPSRAVCTFTVQKHTQPNKAVSGENCFFEIWLAHVRIWTLKFQLPFLEIVFILCDWTTGMPSAAPTIVSGAENTVESVSPKRCMWFAWCLTNIF